MKRVLTALALVIALAAGGATARQNDDRLEALFARLTETRDPIEARHLQAGIWELWFRSGSDTVDLLLRSGEHAMAVRDYRKALHLFDAAVEADPDLAEAWNRRATLYFKMGRFADSVRDIQRTLSLEPRHFGALSGLGLIYDATGNAGGALKAYRKALAVNPHLEHAKARVKALAVEVEGRPI